MIQAIAGAGIGGLLVGAVSSAVLMGWYKDAIWENSVNEIKIDAANVLITETDKVLKQERLANARVRELEAGYEKTTDEIQDLKRSNRALATQLGGLRDPGRRPSRAATVPHIAGEAKRVEEPAACSTLSAEATGFLLEQFALADEVAAYAATAYEWAREVDRVFPPDTEETP